MATPNKSMHPISLQKIHTIYCSGLAIAIVALRGNYTHRKIRESLLGSSGVRRCPRLINRCTFLLANKQAGKYISATELELNRFRTFSLGELVWHLSTQMNDSYLLS